jgi:kynureninase
LTFLSAHFAKVSTEMKYSLEMCREIDDRDKLGRFKQAFNLPSGIIYLDGNSLGALPGHTRQRIEKIIDDEWGKHLIDGWNVSWWQAPSRIGSMLARLIGAKSEEVIVTDTISVNLFKLIAYSMNLSPGRRVILSEGGNFPTDQYIAQGFAKLQPHIEHRTMPPGCIDPKPHFTSEVAVAILSHIDYRTGALRDMHAITARGREAGVHIIWDLAHSAGAYPVDLNGAHAEFAVGCTYKYLNGGPGSPAFIYVRKDLCELTEQPLAGWFGHADPFAFEEKYRPGSGLRRFLTGTHSALSLGALEAGMELWKEVDLEELRKKSISLTSLFIDLMRPIAERQKLSLITPIDPALRGSHVAYLCDDLGYNVIRALASRGVIADFRAPNLLRFGFASLYLSHQDVWHAVKHLSAVFDSGEFRESRFECRAITT